MPSSSCSSTFSVLIGSSGQVQKVVMNSTLGLMVEILPISHWMLGGIGADSTVACAYLTRETAGDGGSSYRFGTCALSREDTSGASRRAAAGRLVRRLVRGRRRWRHGGPIDVAAPPYTWPRYVGSRLTRSSIAAPIDTKPSATYPTRDPLTASHSK